MRKFLFFSILALNSKKYLINSSIFYLCFTIIFLNIISRIVDEKIILKFNAFLIILVLWSISLLFIEFHKGLMILFLTIFSIHPIMSHLYFNRIHIGIGFELLFLPLFFMLILSYKISRREFFLKPINFLYPFILILISSLISFISSINLAFSLYALIYYILSSILYFYIIFFFRTKRDITLLLWIYILLTIVILLVAIKEILSIEKLPSIVSLLKPFAFSKRVTGGFTGANSLSAFLVVTIPLLWSISLPKSIIYSIIRYILLIILITILGFTLSRNGYISFMGSFFSLVLIYSIKRRKIAYIFLYFLFLLLLLLLAFYFNPEIIKRLITLGFLKYDLSAITRLYLWKNSVKLFLENPLTGVGLFNFFLLPASFYRYTGPHNLLLSVLVELGILGAIGVVWLLYRIFYLLVKFIKLPLEKGDFRMTSGLITLWIAFSIHNIFDNVWNVVNHPRQVLLFWFYLAVTSVWINILRRNYSLQNEKL